MDAESYFKTILHDLKIELSDEFDRNFERKAFFDKKWPDRKTQDAKGSLMIKTGAGRRSIQSKIENKSIVWRSSLPYMGIHNEGGSITVTAKMIRFFWAMYYKASGAVSRGAGGDPLSNARNTRMGNEAAMWKALALLKPGSKIKIPERRYIGNHPMVSQIVQKHVASAVKQIEVDLGKELQKKIPK